MLHQITNSVNILHVHFLICHISSYKMIKLRVLITQRAVKSYHVDSLPCTFALMAVKEDSTYVNALNVKLLKQNCRDKCYRNGQEGCLKQ